VARMGEGKDVYRFLVGRPEGKRPLGTPKHRWEDNIKMDPKKMGIDEANWIRLAQDRVQWRAFVSTVKTFGFQKESRILYDTLSNYHLFKEYPAPWSKCRGAGLRTGRSGFGSRQGLKTVLFATVSRLAVGPTQPLIQWVPGGLTAEIKRLVREADHSPPSSVAAKNAWIYNSTSPYVFVAWCLVKRRDNFTSFIYCILLYYIRINKKPVSDTEYKKHMYSACS